MLKLFAVPPATHARIRRAFARHAIEPPQPGGLRWGIHRGDCSRWFTATPPNPEPIG